MDPEARGEQFIIEDIIAHYNQIKIHDDPWMLSDPRRTAFINLEYGRELTDVVGNYDFSVATVEPENMLRAYMIGMDNVGNNYERFIKTIKMVFFQLGGLSKSIFALFWFFDLYMTPPFRALD